MAMTISEAALYLNESEDNIRLMLMNACPDTFDTLSELSEEQVQLIEQVKGQATQKYQRLSAAEPTGDRYEDSHSGGSEQSGGELSVKYVEALDTATESERQLIQGVLEVFNADAIKLGVVSGTIRASNFIAADKASFSHAIAQFYEQEHDATEQLMQDFVVKNDVAEQLSAMGIDPKASLGNAQKVTATKSDNIISQILSRSKR